MACLLITRTLEGQYPDCEAVIEPFREQYSRCFTVERIALQKALERFLIFTDKSHKAVTVRLDTANQQMHLQMEHDAIGSGSEILNIGMQGDDFQFLYDVRYLWEIVKAISSVEIRFHLASAAIPTLIQPYGKDDGIACSAEYILAPLV